MQRFKDIWLNEEKILEERKHLSVVANSVSELL
jgi:hypothetical protein